MQMPMWLAGWYYCKSDSGGLSVFASVHCFLMVSGRIPAKGIQVVCKTRIRCPVLFFGTFEFSYVDMPHVHKVVVSTVVFYCIRTWKITLGIIYVYWCKPPRGRRCINTFLQIIFLTYMQLYACFHIYIFPPHWFLYFFGFYTSMMSWQYQN